MSYYRPPMGDYKTYEDRPDHNRRTGRRAGRRGHWWPRRWRRWRQTHQGHPPPRHVPRRCGFSGRHANRWSVHTGRHGPGSRTTPPVHGYGAGRFTHGRSRWDGVPEWLSLRQRRLRPLGSKSAHERRQPESIAPVAPPRAGIRETSPPHVHDQRHRQTEETARLMRVGCGQCGKKKRLCGHCHRCDDHCHCGAMFDADELGLDPETDNTPDSEDRHA